MAADVLAGVHRETHGRDGFVSLEVAPDLALRHRAARSRGARIYWQRARPPQRDDQDPRHAGGRARRSSRRSTRASTSTSRCCSRSRHTSAVAEAYLRGLERRHAEGSSLDVHSVASFFVSRVDTNVDKKLEQLGRTDLAGHGRGGERTRARTAASRRSSPARAGRRCATPAHAVQRPLWASTGTKNPAYPDTKYVDGLVGPHTVNTMPLATLQAFADHGHVTGPDGGAATPREDLEALAEAGIDMSQVTDELLVDGVEQFEDAMNRLLAGIEEQARAGDHRRRRARSRASSPPSSRSRSPSASSARSARTSRSASGGATHRCGAAPASPRSRTGSAG